MTLKGAWVNITASKESCQKRLYIKYIKLPEVNVTAKSDHTGYSTPDKTIDLDKKDPSGKKYPGLFQMIYVEFGEKAFTAIGFGTHGKVFLRLAQNLKLMLWELLCTYFRRIQSYIYQLFH
jgi:hypothetical protein